MKFVAFGPIVLHFIVHYVCHENGRRSEERGGGCGYVVLSFIPLSFLHVLFKLSSLYMCLLYIIRIYNVLDETFYLIKCRKNVHLFVCLLFSFDIRTREKKGKRISRKPQVHSISFCFLKKKTSSFNMYIHCVNINKRINVDKKENTMKFVVFPFHIEFLLFICTSHDRHELSLHK